MTEQIPLNRQDNAKNQAMVLKTIQFTGFGLIFFGISLYFNLWNSAEFLDLNTDNMNKIIGAMCGVMGIMDVFAIPVLITKKK